MKTWNYTRAIRWLAIEPETRKLREIKYSCPSLYSLKSLLEEWNEYEFVTSMEFEPPTDPVPLAEVLYELVSGEEEEFELRSPTGSYNRLDYTHGNFLLWNTRNPSHKTTGLGFETKDLTFHRIAEPEEKKRESRERWFVISGDGRLVNSFAKKEDAEEMGRALSSLYKSSKHEVAKFREVVE